MTARYTEALYVSGQEGPRLPTGESQKAEGLQGSTAASCPTVQGTRHPRGSCRHCEAGSQLQVHELTKDVRG